MHVFYILLVSLVNLIIFYCISVHFYNNKNNESLKSQEVTNWI